MAKNTNTTVTGWVGWAYFAAYIMMLSGFFQMIYGLTAVLNDKYFVVTSTHLLTFDVSTWGWIHLLTGALVLLAGLTLLSGSLYGRTVGVIVAFFSAVVALWDLSLYPVWSVIVITLDVLVIWALTVHGKELKDPLV